MLLKAFRAANRPPVASAPPTAQVLASWHQSYRAKQLAACRLPVVGPVPSRSCPPLPLQFPSKTVFRVLSLVCSFSPSPKEKARQPPSAISGIRLTPSILKAYKRIFRSLEGGFRNCRPRPPPAPAKDASSVRFSVRPPSPVRKPDRSAEFSQFASAPSRTYAPSLSPSAYSAGSGDRRRQGAAHR